MPSKLGRYLHHLWQSVVYWSLALGFFAILRYYGADGNSAAIINPNLDEKSPILPHLSVLMSMGACLGVLYALIEWYFENSILRRFTLGLHLMLKTMAYFISSIIIFTIVLNITSNILPVDFNLERGWWIANKTVWVLLFYIFFGSLVFSFLKMASERFGKNMFLKTLVGRFKYPHEQHRIFMFADLKDATSLAERLGHFRYSQLIQDCFEDLNHIAPLYEAEIYQYVGDEAVLTWPFEKGVRNNNCIHFFRAFQKQLSIRESYYQQKYGALPIFKAGVHGGKLIVVEVGHVKKELAYHGDVINTAARIQGQCNLNNSDFLISEELLKHLDDGINVTKIEEKVTLKGKDNKVVIYSINRE